MIEQAVLAAIDALQMKYLGALDQRDFDAWLDCFADEAAYICISRENHEASLPVAIMMDDTRARLRDRTTRIRSWARDRISGCSHWGHAEDGGNGCAHRHTTKHAFPRMGSHPRLSPVLGPTVRRLDLAAGDHPALFR